MLSMDDFKLDRQVFEARFVPSYLIWDRAGEMWSMVARDFESLSMVSAVPNNTQFESDSYYLTAETNLLRVICRGNTSFEEFDEKTHAFFRIVVKFMEIEAFTRLGLRTISIKQFPAMKDARTALSNMGILRDLNGESFGVKDQTPGAELKTTWEDDHRGVTFAVRTERRHVELQIPWEVRSQVNLKAEERYALVLDVDYFTVPKIRTEQIEVREWLGNARRLIKKGLTKEVFG